MANVTDPTTISLNTPSLTAPLQSIKNYLVNLVSGALVPIGGIVDWPNDVLPTGSWIWADGKSYSTTDKAALFAVYGYKHGGSGSTFYVPDRRGKFTRGIDKFGQGASGNDPDAAARTAAQAGGNAGNNVGSVQADAGQGHFHVPLGGGDVFLDSVGAGGAEQLPGPGTTLIGRATTGAATTDGINGTPRTSSETRPINDSTTYIIRYA